MHNFAWDNKLLGHALGLDLTRDFKANNVEFNSKDIIPGDVFIALPGGKKDSNQYINDAFQNGAVVAISNEKSLIKDENVIYVPNTFEALSKLANYKRGNVKAKFIGVTGSVGKTSTKTAIASILSSFKPTFSNKGNFNNYIGVPISLASIPEKTEFSVNEIGMNHAGEIRELTKLVKPDIAIITKIGEAHLEFFDSVEDICRAKCEIFEGLDKEGVAIINRDCKYFDIQLDILKKLKIQNIYTFGEHSASDCSVLDYINHASHSEVVYNILGKKYKIQNNLLSKHQSINLASALLTSLILGLDVDQAVNSIYNIKIPYGRGDEFKIEINQRTLGIIDDAYNANPLSLKAALQDLEARQGIKIAILSDMKELGENAPQLHEEMLEYVVKSGVTTLITVGDLMKNLNLAAHHIPSIDTVHFDEANDAVFSEMLNIISKKDATILIKGSKSTDIRKLVGYLREKDQKKNIEEKYRRKK